MTAGCMERAVLSLVSDCEVAVSFIARDRAEGELLCGKAATGHVVVPTYICMYVCMYVCI